MAWSRSVSWAGSNLVGRNTKGKPVYPTDMSLMKSLYLATENATKKWSQRQRNWDQIINELSIIHS